MRLYLPSCPHPSHAQIRGKTSRPESSVEANYKLLSVWLLRDTTLPSYNEPEVCGEEWLKNKWTHCLKGEFLSWSIALWLTGLLFLSTGERAKIQRETLEINMASIMARFCIAKVKSASSWVKNLIHSFSPYCKFLGKKPHPLFLPILQWLCYPSQFKRQKLYLGSRNLAGLSCVDGDHGWNTVRATEKLTVELGRHWLQSIRILCDKSSCRNGLILLLAHKERTNWFSLQESQNWWHLSSMRVEIDT